MTHLDLWHNQITSVSKDTSNLTLKNLKKLKLQNNYIFKLSDKVFSFSFFTQLKYLDLRWNPFKCYCEITLTLGRWLSDRPYCLKSIPGFLPTCSYLLNSFGGCVTCAVSHCEDTTLLKQSLLQYSTTDFCYNSFSTYLAITVLTLVFVLLLPHLPCFYQVARECFGWRNSQHEGFVHQRGQQKNRFENVRLSWFCYIRHNGL